MEWRHAVDAVIADWARTTIVVQPIAQLEHGGVAGFEALARFDGEIAAPPNEWFAAAEAVGLRRELELRAFEVAWELKERLPDDTFLSLNLTPSLIQSGAIDDAGDLTRVVIEITEHEPIADYTDLARCLQRLRARGALLAVDDAGAGYASLRHVLALRPDFVKLDRALVSGIDRDVAKRAIVEMLGDFCDRIDAWVVAEGVEREEELDELHRLGVPLAQGYLLGRPAAPWPTPETVHDEVRERHRSLAGPDGARAIATLVERVRVVAAHEAKVSFDWAGQAVCIMTDEAGRPVRLLRRRDVDRGSGTGVRPLCLQARTPRVEAMKRALTRPADARFDPIVVHDPRGTLLGIVPVDRLMAALVADDA